MGDMNGNERETLVVSKHPLRPGGMAEVLRLAAPAVAATASQVVMNFTDSIMVAGVAPGAVGAVMGASMFFFVFTVFLGGLMSATTTFGSQACGRGEPREAARYTWQAIWFSPLVGGLGLVAIPFLPWFFAWVGHTPDVQAMEVTFSSYMCAALLFSSLRWSLQGFFQAVGWTRLIMVVSVATAALNIVLNWLLIYGVGPFPRMGVAGSGLATVISTAVAAVLFLMAFLLGRAAQEHGTRTTLAPSLARFKNLVRVGLPTAFQWSLDVAVWAVWHNLLVGRLGREEFLDANAAAMAITELAWLPVIGLGQSACSLVGWYIGRRKPESMRRAVGNCLRLSAAYMILLSLVMLFAGRPIVEFFFQQQAGVANPASYAEVVALGVVALRIAATFQIFDGCNITLMGVLRGGGDTLWPAVAQQLVAWLVFAPLAWLMCYPLHLGLAGAWWASAAYLALLCGVLYWRYRQAGWLRHDIFRGTDRAEAAS
jgi:multidrug resistance protein, MATE family